MADERHRHARGRWTAVLVAALAVLVAAVAALGAIGYSYLQGQQKYGRLAQHADITDGGVPVSVDWDALRAVNPDVVAWLCIPGTAVNYPVVRGEDNEHYLRHDFEGDEGWLASYGAIFMDWRDDPDWSDQGYYFYGHHMRDGSMFADIAGLADQDRFDASRTIYLLSPTKDFTLKTFSLIHCSDDDPIVQIDFASEGEMADYVQDKIDRSIVNVGEVPEATSIDQLFAFATCDDFSTGRYVLYASATAE